MLSPSMPILMRYSLTLRSCEFVCVYTVLITSLRYPEIVDVMPLKRFDALKRSLHVADNSAYNEKENDKCSKLDH